NLVLTQSPFRWLVTFHYAMAALADSEINTVMIVAAPIRFSRPRDFVARNLIEAGVLRATDRGEISQIIITGVTAAAEEMLTFKAINLDLLFDIIDLEMAGKISGARLLRMCD
ncbi:MAG: hypothetical protein ACXVBW_10160, partial [Bdellovibrionota bacterium]